MREHIVPQLCYKLLYTIDPSYQWHFIRMTILCTTSLASYFCFQTRNFSHKYLALDVYVTLYIIMLLTIFNQGAAHLAGFQWGPANNYKLQLSKKIQWHYNIKIITRAQQFLLCIVIQISKPFMQRLYTQLQLIASVGKENSLISIEHIQTPYSSHWHLGSFLWFFSQHMMSQEFLFPCPISYESNRSTVCRQHICKW